MYEASPIPILLVQLALILALARMMGALFALMHQPKVMGEMVAGIMLGPSLFGLLAPELSLRIFPPESIHYLYILAQLGVVFFLFLIGLELDPRLLRNRGHAAVVISHVSIVAPLLLGAGLALYLYPRLFNDAPSMRFTAVALFLGAAMSITAFPVLARILTERNLHKTNVGAIAITCAAVDDATAWCLLAFVIAVARADGLHPAMWTAVLAVVYVLLMFFLVRPFLHRLQLMYDRQGRLSQGLVAIVLLLVLSSAWATEMIGIHALFGAFLIGAIMPKGTRFVRELSDKLEDYTVVFLLPIFFAYAGLNTRIGLLNNAEMWFYTGLIIFVACLGKWGGSTFAARACALGWRESSAIGILMNTRGLMEIVILNIGRELGVITDAVFAMMIIMALFTTFMTTPVLQLIYPARRFGADEAAAKMVTAPPVFSVLVPVASPQSGEQLVKLADQIVGERNDVPRIYALHLRQPVDHEAYRAGLEEAEPARLETLGPTLDLAKREGIAVEPISFVSRDIPSDIAQVARAKRINLVLMGYHKPVFSRTMLGGTVHRVLSQCETDVGIFVDRGMQKIQRILVPFLGGKHDRLAMEIAGRVARHEAARVTVLRVVPPGRASDATTSNAQTMVERVMEDPARPVPVTFTVIESDSPVETVLRQAQQFDLVVVGISEEWGLESSLFGWRAERIAADCPSSMLLVRKYGSAEPVAPASAPAASVHNPSKHAP